MADDYDSPWKEAIERYCPDFMHFYFPAAHAHIDWSQPYLFLDQDWSGSEARLADSGNPFAVVTQAHLATRETKGDAVARHAAKWRLVQGLYRRGFERQQVVDLFRGIDWMMRLPKELQVQLRQDLHTLEEESKMTYVTSIERLAIEEGMQKGMEKGMQQGRREGKVQLLTRQLAARFGALPLWVGDRLARADENTLDGWTEAVLSAGSVNEMFGIDQP